MNQIGEHDNRCNPRMDAPITVMESIGEIDGATLSIDVHATRPLLWYILVSVKINAG